MKVDPMKYASGVILQHPKSYYDNAKDAAYNENISNKNTTKNNDNSGNINNPLTPLLASSPQTSQKD